MTHTVFGSDLAPSGSVLVTPALNFTIFGEAMKDRSLLMPSLKTKTTIMEQSSQTAWLFDQLLDMQVC